MPKDAVESAFSRASRQCSDVEPPVAPVHRRERYATPWRLAARHPELTYAEGTAIAPDGLAIRTLRSPATGAHDPTWGNQGKDYEGAPLDPSYVRRLAALQWEPGDGGVRNMLRAHPDEIGEALGGTPLQTNEPADSSPAGDERGTLDNGRQRRTGTPVQTPMRPDVPWDVTALTLGDSGHVILLARVWSDLLRDNELDYAAITQALVEAIDANPTRSSLAATIARPSHVKELPPNDQIRWLLGEINNIA